MSFFKKLFGGGGDDSAGGDKILGETEYQGFTIRSIEMKAQGGFQLCGEIELKVDGEEPKVHRFIRADQLNSAEQVTSLAFSKGQQLIDQQRDSLFD